MAKAYYPTLAGEMAKAGITKRQLARSLSISDRALINRTTGRIPFTWPEVLTIRDSFFPDMELEELFRTET